MRSCEPPTHYYLTFAYSGIRSLTCQCGSTISKFDIKKNTGEIITIAMNVGALDTRHNEN